MERISAAGENRPPVGGRFLAIRPLVSFAPVLRSSARGAATATAAGGGQLACSVCVRRMRQPRAACAGTAVRDLVPLPGAFYLQTRSFPARGPGRRPNRAHAENFAEGDPWRAPGVTVRAAEAGRMPSIRARCVSAGGAIDGPPNGLIGWTGR